MILVTDLLGGWLEWVGWAAAALPIVLKFGSSTNTTTPVIPDELKPLITGSAQNIQNLQNQLPLSLFTGYNPRNIADLSNLTKYGLENIPNLQMVEPGYLGAFSSMATVPELTSRPVPTPGAESAQYGQLQNVVGGPVGGSPATQQAMKAWEMYTKPQVQQESVLAGFGRSGLALEAQNRSATEALVPFLQQEVQNRMESVALLQSMADAETERYLFPRKQTVDALLETSRQMKDLGDSMFNQRVTAIDQQLRGGRITEDKAQQLFDSAYDEFLRLQSLSEAASLGIFGQTAPSTIGSKSKGKSQSIDIGQLAGSAAGAIAMSDERSKRDITAVPEEDALEKIDRVPVADWEYKDEGPGAPRHRGPMAQDYRREFGPPVPIEGPDGMEQIDLGDLLGNLMAATQSLKRRVDALGGEERPS